MIRGEETGRKRKYSWVEPLSVDGALEGFWDGEYLEYKNQRKSKSLIQILLSLITLI
ncbi:hypothetical protein [Clostridium botulinum]|uniref:hypothetical protein n=1 Tax=Clostridium botulinum TaxID=1491 RepID=UPI00137726EA|nr:hypothetical protein [Clostridium botulinum]